jgi:hypothetical protein
MATKIVSDDDSTSNNESVSGLNTQKSYRPPSLAKGLTLSAITAGDTRVSGITQDEIPV